MKEIIEALQIAKRPVIIYGAGIKHATQEASQLAHMLGIPIVVTWGARDVFPESDSLCIGGFGTHGTRAANFAVANSDLVVSIGSRLDSKATGTPPANFARRAKIFMCDIDPAETRKLALVGVAVSPINRDAKSFLSDLTGSLTGTFPDYSAWHSRCLEWKRKYPCGPAEQKDGCIEPYALIDGLSSALQDGEIIVSDTGCVLAWMMQAFKFKRGQKFLHPMNNTPMGYALPAAIGAHYATGKRIIVTTGDGSIMMSIAELATIAGNKLPIHIILFNNQGHAMCRQTQREWLEGKYFSTSIDNGLTFPNFQKVAEAHGFKYHKLAIPNAQAIARILERPSSFTEVIISPDADVIPKTQFGKPNEDGYPPLPRDEFNAQVVND